MRSTTFAASLAAAALTLVPSLTANGIDMAGPTLHDPGVLREIAAAADVLATCARTERPCRDATTYGLKGAIEARTGRRIGSGAVLAAAIGLGITWRRLGDGPDAALAVRPPPRWTRPTPEHVAQALRRLGGSAARRTVAATVSDACRGNLGHAPPRRAVREAINLAVVSGVACADGQGLRLIGGAA